MNAIYSIYNKINNISLVEDRSASEDYLDFKLISDSRNYNSIDPSVNLISLYPENKKELSLLTGIEMNLLQK